MRFLGLLLVGLLVWAQEDPLRFGLWVRAHSGLGLGFWGKLANDLKAADALGKDLQLVPWATTAGANLEFLLGRRLLLSGGFQLMHFDASETERGLARPYAFHYGGQLGFAAINKNTWLFYPYAGYSIGRAELRYTNYFTEPIRFGANQQVQPLTKATYKTDLGLAEIGLGLRRFRKGTGLNYFWGVDLGAQVSPSKGTWKSDQDPQPQGVSPVQLTAIYLRFSLGFGYTKAGEPQAPSAIPTAPEKPKKERKAKIEAEQPAAPPPAEPAPPKKAKKSKKQAEDNE